MAQKTRPQAETLSGSPQPNFTGYATAPIKAKRNPTTSDTGYGLGQLWVNKSTGNSFQLTQVSAGVANWVEIGITSGSAIQTLTGDTGGALSPSAGNMNILGGNTVVVDGSGSTLTINAKEGSYPITPFVVGASGQAGYQTVQAAVNAAHAAGGGMVFVQPGTYTENLTFYDKIQLTGVSEQNTIINGTHVPPTSGTLNINRVALVSSTNIFNSSSAGTTAIIMEDTLVNVTNGYTFNLPNWTGQIQCFNIGNFGTNDGFINNTGAADVFIFSAGAGNGTLNPMILSGFTLFGSGLQISCPVNVTGASSFTSLNSSYTSTVTFSDSASGSFYGDSFITGSSPAITQSSTGTLGLNNVSIETSNNPAISGSGAGTITLSTCTFSNNASLAGTLTLAYGSTKTGAFTANGATTIASGTGAINVSADAAATAVNIGTGAAAKTLTIGSTNSTSTTNIQSGSGGIVLAGKLNLVSGGPQVLSGSGSPNTSVTAPQGSLYLNTAGSGVGDRAFINTNGATAWTAITTVA